MNLTEIYLEHKNQIFTFVYYKVNIVEVAEEITNDTFMRIANKVYDSEKSAMYTWLQGIANNLVKDYWRTLQTEKSDKNKTVRIGDFVNDNGQERFNYGFSADADELVKRSEDQKRIANAFRSLKPNYRKVAIAFFLRELKLSEIVEKLNIPLGTVKGQINRARKMLQAELV